MTKNAQRILPLAFIGLLVALWQLAVSHQTYSIMPSPWAVVKGIVELARKGLLLKYVVASLFRVTWGFLSAVAVGIPLGLFLGWHRRAGTAFNPIIQVLRPISALAWIPIAILWFGVGDLSAIFLIFVGCFFSLLLTAISAVHNIPDVYINIG